MKRKITVASLVMALVCVALISMALEVALAIPSAYAFPVLLALSFIPRSAEVSLWAGLYPEVWTSEIIKRFDSLDQDEWRQGIPDKSQYASMTNDGESVVINLTYFGVSPDVLIDNNTYPIPIQDLTGENIPISLKKFQTKVTPITDDEARGLKYDKIRVAQESHATKIGEEKNDLAIHSIAPAGNTANTPVLVTTGADDGTGRKMLVKADILTLKKAWDDKKIPKKGRRLVLCNDHVNDLLTQDQKFQEQYYNYTSGKIANMFSFEIFEYPTMPLYDPVAKTKLAYGGVVTTHRTASVAFHVQRVAQAKGFTKAYLSLSSQDPQNQRSLLAYRHYDLVLPVKQEAIAAIVSAPAA